MTTHARTPSLNDATTSWLGAEKQHLDASIAWLNDALRHDPAATPQAQFDRLLDVAFDGARLALQHTQERTHALRDQAQRIERSSLEALGLSPDQFLGWQKQWVEAQQQALSHSNDWTHRWWDQTREQFATAAATPAPTPAKAAATARAR